VVADPQDSLPEKSKRGSVQLVDDDGDSTMDSGEESDDTTTGTEGQGSSSTKPPAFTSIGSPNVPSHKELLPLNSRIADASPQEQLKRDPEGDEASGAVKVEGLMDTSENPLRL
jgi:protein phosphatase 2C family protein 2/3